MTDAQYIEAFLRNDQDGIRRAYETMKKPFVAFLRFRFSCLSEEDMQDAYHDAFIILQQNILNQKLTTSNLHSTLQSYLHSIGWFVARDMLRQADKMPLSPEEDIPEDIESNCMEDMQTREKNDIILQCVMQMKAPCAPILLAFYWDNLSLEQLAQKLHYANADSAKNQKSRCIQKLKAFIGSTLKAHGYE